MEWAQAIGIASWCFIAGLFVGELIAKRGQKRAEVLDGLWAKATKDVRQFETFAGVQVVNTAVIKDEFGELWRISIERETA